jgi:flagellar motor switch protein FliM
MEPILSKQEIAELLRSIREGVLPPQSTSVGSRDQPAVASHRAIDLFGAGSRRDRSVRIANFHIIVDLFAEHYTLTLSRLLQRNVLVSLSSLESRPFQEYLGTHQRPGAIGVLNQAPLTCDGLINFERNLAFLILQVMLGVTADLEMTQPERKLTRLELSVLKNPMSLACDDLDLSFSPIKTTATELLRLESDLRLVSITDPESEIITATFEVEIDDRRGNMEIVFCASALEPYRQAFINLSSGHRTADDTWTAIIAEQINTLAVEVSAQAAILELSLRELSGLRNGDILGVDHDFGRNLQILVGGTVKFKGLAGQHKGRKTASITEVLQ